MNRKLAITLISISTITTILCTTLFVRHQLSIQPISTSLPQENQQQTSENITKPESDQIQQSPDTLEIPVKTEPSETVTQPVGELIPEPNWWNYPSQILATTKTGDDLLVLVNKYYSLPSTYAPTDLVPASNSEIRVTSAIQLRSILTDQLIKMRNDSSIAGIDLTIASGYRSFATQDATYKYWVGYFGGNIDETDKISARAGHSQHQLGTVIDFSTQSIGNQIGPIFNGTTTQIWLSENAWKYGFALSYPEGGETTTGYSYESWHYRFIGVENAVQWHNSGKILELWLQEKSSI